MRVLIDIHPDIRCGPESRILPFIAKYGDRIVNSPDKKKLASIGLYPNAFNDATRAFISIMIEAAGPPAKRLCDKDPYILFGLEFLAGIFPYSQFIYMVRDGRAVTNSIVKRNVTIRNIDITNPDKILEKWDSFNNQSLMQCLNVGPERCLVVKYEELALQPKRIMKMITEFLGVELVPEMLNHSDAMKETVLSKFEKSTDQVIHPIHLEALSSWAGEKSRLTDNFIRTASSPMLEKFGYTPGVIPPFYGEPEPEQLEKTAKLRQNVDFKKVFMS